MAHTYENRYLWCGHVEQEQRVSAHQGGRRVTDLRSTNGFCSACWSDSRLSTADRRKDVPKGTSYAPANEVTQEWVTTIWNRVQQNEHLFPMENFPEFKGASSADMFWLRLLTEELRNDFMWRLTNPDARQPTRRDRLVILQLQTAINEIAIDYRDAIYRHPMHGLSRTDMLLTFIPPDQVPEGEVCVICRQLIGTPDRDGNLECAYRTRCNHVFGEKCIKSWIDDHFGPACPVCRAHFESDEELEREIRHNVLRENQSIHQDPGNEDKLWWMRVLKGE